jgi:hypothetical protein
MMLSRWARTRSLRGSSRRRACPLGREGSSGRDGVCHARAWGVRVFGPRMLALASPTLATFRHPVGFGYDSVQRCGSSGGHVVTIWVIRSGQE